MSGTYFTAFESCIAPGSLDTSLSQAAGLTDIARLFLAPSGSPLVIAGPCQCAFTAPTHAKKRSLE